jgi:putative transposase
MTVTTDAVDTAAVAKKNQGPGLPAGVNDDLIGQLVEQARTSGLQLTGEGGLLQQLTKRVIEAAMDGEITDHLGYEKHDPAGKDGGNSRNGSRAKTVLTDVGPVEIVVPRDRDGSFEPQIVKKRQRRLTGVEDMVLSLSAKGLTTGEISAHLAEVYGAEVSKQTISTITDKVMDGMAEWQNRPLDRVYPVVFLDAINVKVRDGKVANRPIYVALAVTAEGTRDILGLWAGDGGEGAKFWFSVCTELKNRGVEDVLMAVCDGLTGLPDAINTVWPQTVVQTCIVHRTRKESSCRCVGAEVAVSLVNVDGLEELFGVFEAAGGWGEGDGAFAEDGQGVGEGVVEGAEADVESCGEDVSGGEFAFVEHGGEHAFGVGDLLPEDAAAGSGLAWSAALAVSAFLDQGCLLQR